MKFDWAEAFKSITPVMLYALCLFVLYMIVLAMIWVEDHTGIPVPAMFIALVCVAMFVLSGLGVF